MGIFIIPFITTLVPIGTVGLLASTAIVWFALGIAPLAVGPPDHRPQQNVFLCLQMLFGVFILTINRCINATSDG